MNRDDTIRTRTIDWVLDLCPEIQQWQAEIIAEYASNLVKNEREDNMATQPEALRLADILQHRLPSIECLERAAAELRRLHEENEHLHQINQSHEMKLSVRGYEIRIADLEEVNTELLGVLKILLPGAEAMGWDTDKARAAVTKAESL
jgi:hypothetical protein